VGRGERIAILSEALAVFKDVHGNILQFKDVFQAYNESDNELIV